MREEPLFGDWTAKDVLAHVAAWDRELVRGLDEILAGHRPSFASYSEEEFNEAAVRASRARPFAGVLAELREAHEALVNRIEALTDNEWEAPSPHRWSYQSPITVASLFGYSYKGETHYGGHASEIEAWAAGNGT